MASTTTYNKFFIRTYLSRRQLRELVEEHLPEIKAYAFNEHDRDEAVSHCHLVLWLSRSKAQKTVENWFRPFRDEKGQFIQTRVEVTKTCRKSDGTTEVQTVDLKGATYYLVHEDSKGNPLPNKFHYSWSDVESLNLDSLKCYDYCATKHKKEDKSFEILERLMRGDNLRDLAFEYGRDFIMNYRRYNDLAYSICCHEQAEEERRLRAEEDARWEILKGYMQQGEATKDDIIEGQEDEIQRLRAILRSNHIEY